MGANSEKIVEAVILLTFSIVGTVLPLLFVNKFESKKPHGHSHGAHTEKEWMTFTHTESTRLVEEDRAKAKSVADTIQSSRSGEFVAMVLSLGNAFAGGVMLSVGLVHVLSDALEMSIEAQPSEVKNALLTPLTGSLLGVLIPFFLEKSGLTWWLLQHQACFTDHLADVHGPAHEKHIGYGGLSNVNSHSPPRLERLRSESDILEDIHPTGTDTMCTSKCVIPSVSSTRLQGRLDFYKSVGSHNSLAFAPLVYSEDVLAPVSHRRLSKTNQSQVALEPKHNEEGHEDSHRHPEKHSHMSFATFLMFLVLSIHSLIVGFSIGTIHSEMGSGSSAYIAVAIHKVFESLALGTNAAQHPLNSSVLMELIVYNLAAPLGIVIGSSLFTSGGISAETEALILSIASGSFIYIALVEILVDEFENEEYRIAKFVFFALGSIAMAFLAHAD